MKFTYGTLLSPYPIKLSIGTLRKPTLGEIFHTIGYEQYMTYESFTKLTPKLFYTKLKEGGKEIWDSFTDKQKEEISLFNVVIADEELLQDYLGLLNFFFDEKVISEEGFFIWVNNTADTSDISQLSEDDICGVVADANLFKQVLEAIQQVCCAYKESEQPENLKFKNSLAEKLYRRMEKAAQEEAEKVKSDKNYTIPNIISAVSNNHPTISPINVWDLTVFQLVDAFQRRQISKKDEMDSRTVSVWGDSDNKYDPHVWFKNEYDK